ncbi:MAG: response regulator transcription factor [Bacteroidales bacterium]|nr:response regulator transcription factor [Bacteroidales bacterium]
MLNYIIYPIFIVSVALAAGGVVISSKMRNSFHHPLFSTLFYYQVFIYTFGFYGIWGQVAIKAFLSEYISLDLLNRFSDLAMLMGLPFLVFAWLMLMQFSMEISGKKRSGWFASVFLITNFSILLIVGFVIAREGVTRPVSLMKYYFIFMNFLYSLISSILIMFPGKKLSLIFEHDRKIIGSSVLIIMILQCAPLVFYTSQVHFALIFIFTFFTGNTFLPLYLNYGTLLPAFAGEKSKDLSFADFCKRYEVSPRETDIVIEICNGLSNKEISEKLFISLQTVKDHTHRIYTKTNVKSRVQLINLVKELGK